MYTLKTGIKYKGQNYDAGLSVAVTINGVSVDTRVAVNANQFVVMSGSGSNVYSPFAIVNGQVFISDAFIQNGSITSAKIANAAINNAKISGSIWSEGYKVANQGGWCLSKADNNLSFTGPEGRLFVQIGKLTGVAPNV
ncbi:phage tail tip fiber protein [Citrobacter freundii]|uniref:phage tail tip fiber protein n=1 Tax=Citrobacter freundii TaxID=546 RepID=UPI003FED7EB7